MSIAPVVIVMPIEPEPKDDPANEKRNDDSTDPSPVDGSSIYQTVAPEAELVPVESTAPGSATSGELTTEQLAGTPETIHEQSASVEASGAIVLPAPPEAVLNASKVPEPGAFTKAEEQPAQNLEATLTGEPAREAPAASINEEAGPLPLSLNDVNGASIVTTGDAPNSASLQEGEAAIPATIMAPSGPPIWPVVALSILFTAWSVVMSGLPFAVILGVATSGILTAYWSYINYKLCKQRAPADITPMRALAMSVFVNQFGGAHAVLFANSIFQITFPVIRTLHPPEIVVTFAAVIGVVVIYIVVTLVACLTVWWHVQLANKVYGAGTANNTLAGFAIGTIFAGTGVWMIANVGSSQFSTIGPIAANACYVPVFLIARAMLSGRVACAAPVPILFDGRRMTLEWLLLIVYAFTVVFSSSSPGLYNTFATIFSGIPILIWLAYLLTEKRAASHPKLQQD